MACSNDSFHCPDLHRRFQPDVAKRWLQDRGREGGGGSRPE